MTAGAAGLVLASAFLHALWNALVKGAREPPVASAGVLVVAAATAAAVVPLSPGTAFPDRAALGWALAAGLCEGGYFLSVSRALAAAPLGIAYTLSRGGAIALVWPASALWFGETVTPQSAAGAAVLVLGLLCIGLVGGARASAGGMAWALASAVGIAGYHLFYKRGLAAGADPSALFAVSLALAVPLHLASLGRNTVPRVLQHLRQQPLRVVGGGLICAASFLVFLGALAAGGAGAVLTLRNTSVVFAQVLAYGMGERFNRTHYLGAGLVLAGAAVLAWP